ncbi:hypothetical protein [Phyllobacterium sp. 628]|nr:hypothetical protein [Phyllobacterium sp. 628]
MRTIGDLLPIALKPDDIAVDFLGTEERNHTSDDRDPFQRWEE